MSSVNLDLRGCMLLLSLGFGGSGDVSGKMEEFFPHNENRFLGI